VYSAVRFSESTPSPRDSCLVNDPWGLGDNDRLALAIVRRAIGPDRQDAALDGHLYAVRVDAGQVGLNVIAAVFTAVDVQGHPQWGTRPTRGHGQEPVELPEGVTEGLEPHN